MKTINYHKDDQLSWLELEGAVAFPLKEEGGFSFLSDLGVIAKSF